MVPGLERDTCINGVGRPTDHNNHGNSMVAGAVLGQMPLLTPGEQSALGLIGLIVLAIVTSVEAGLAVKTLAKHRDGFQSQDSAHLWLQKCHPNH